MGNYRVGNKYFNSIADAFAFADTNGGMVEVFSPYRRDWGEGARPAAYDDGSLAAQDAADREEAEQIEAEWRDDAGYGYE